MFIDSFIAVINVATERESVRMMIKGCIGDFLILLNKK